MLEFERSVPLAVLFEDRTRQLNRVYEVKITTLMTNRPRHADINTIEDLKRNGIKVLLPPMKLSAYEEKLIDLQFEHIDPSTQMENSLDGIHSYLFEEQSAVLYKFMCQEEDKERCMAYTSLSEKVKLLMRGNYIFNPTLMEPFSWIHQLLIESGIHNFSRENITSFVVGGLLKYRTLSDNAQVANMLNIADLKPAWISLGIGYAVGFSVAVFELAFHTLIIFFFIILSVYEVKIMTLMTNRPRHADVKSIEDLNRKGIKVWCPPHKLSPGDEKNLNLDFESMDNESNTLDGIHTYLFDEQSALLFEHMCGGNTELYSLYIILGEKLRMFIIGNVIFNPTLMEPFRLTHESLIESGIHRFLREGLISHTVGGLHTYKSYQQKQQVTSMLNIEDLLPACL
ncbi:hypothetical protein quinque_007490 [Culex quinquefasciatus]